MEIRLITQNDYQQVADIYNAGWDITNTPHLEEYTAAVIAKMISAGAQFVLATQQATVLGVLEFRRGEAFRAHTLSMGIVISEQARNQGLGKQLINWLKAYAKEHQIIKINLRVLGTNPGAIRFYQRNGFEIEGTLQQQFYLNGQFVDDIFMTFFIN
ncbi:MAG: GNAT family N-acetyltransferase [Lactobacillaceae bacterium]|jgi:RimJ/RimL family protein N-acetyltransferase|nr:GNAT family N-acetyltransferase [Lactobacillaceae bacterium]